MKHAALLAAFVALVLPAMWLLELGVLKSDQWRRYRDEVME